MLKKLFHIVKTLVFRLRADYTTEDLVSMGLVIGDNFNRMHGTILDPSHCWLIHIGDNVTLAPRVHILAHDASTYMWLGYTRIGTVTIGNNVFIGADSVILPGVTIGNNVVIGANSTVTGDIPADTVAVGNPARVISSIETFVAKNKENMKTCPIFGSDYTLNGHINDKKKKAMYDKLRSTIGYVR